MRFPLAAVALTLGVVASTSASTAQADPAGSYGTKTPYQLGQDLGTLQQPPSDYTAVFTENVSRHGERTMTSSKDGDMLLQLWQQASNEGSLTPLGQSFGSDVQAFLDAEAKVGYGQLTGLGKADLTATGARLVQRLPDLFQNVVQNPDPNGQPAIDVVTAGQPRVIDSATAFVSGMTGSNPGLSGAVGPMRTDQDLLYFHEAAANADYRDYVANDQHLASTLAAIREQDESHQVADRVLQRIFTPDFVSRVAAGAYNFAADDITAAHAIYDLYSSAPSLADEGAWHFDQYVSSDDADWLAYLDDASEFYDKGPGFAGSDITYRMAGVLLNDFFAQVEAKRAGTSSLAAELRFTHAEEIIPLAALMQLPGSTVQATDAAPYTYADNPWRGASVAPMGANIQWDVFQNGSRYLVRMLHNEQQVPFKQDCKPIADGSYFYDLNELEHCFGRNQ